MILVLPVKSMKNNCKTDHKPGCSWKSPRCIVQFWWLRDNEGVCQGGIWLAFWRGVGMFLKWIWVPENSVPVWILYSLQNALNNQTPYSLWRSTVYTVWIAHFTLSSDEESCWVVDLWWSTNGTSLVHPWSFQTHQRYINSGIFATL